MATVDHVPLGDWKVPAPGAALTSAVQGLGTNPMVYAGLCQYLEKSGRSGTGYNASVAAGTYLGLFGDTAQGTDVGRYFELFTLGNSALTAKAFVTMTRRTGTVVLVAGGNTLGEAAITTASSVNYYTLGVAVGDRVVIATGADAGTYRVSVVEVSQLTVTNIGGGAVTFAGVGGGSYTVTTQALKMGSGTINKDKPSFATLQGYLGAVDGVARHWSPGGWLATNSVIVAPYHGNNTGTGPNVMDRVMLDYMIRNDAPAGANTFTTMQNLATSGAAALTQSFMAASPTAGASGTGDAVYFGHATPFASVEVILNAASGTWTYTWEYYNGSAWTALTVLADAVTSFRGGTGQPLYPATKIDFTFPIDMSRVAVNGVTVYWIRARLSAYTSTTTAPTGGSGKGQRVLTASAAGLVSSVTGRDATLPVVTSFGGQSGDAIYFGATTTFTRFKILLATAGVYTSAARWEFWNGSAWAALTTITDGSATAAGPCQQAAGTYNAEFVAPGSWATRTLHTTTAYYWIRLALTATAAGTVNPRLDAVIQATEDTTEFVPSCLAISENPATNAPQLISWGIPLPIDIPANSSGLATFWHSTRRIKSRRFGLAMTGTGSQYQTPNTRASADSIAIWSDTTAAATLTGTIPLNGAYTITPGTADPSITCGNDAGPPIPLDETTVQAARTGQAGTYKYLTVSRRRVYNWGGTAIITLASGAQESSDCYCQWSELDQFHHYQHSSILKIGASDGDQASGCATLQDKVVLFKRHHIYFLAGEPSVAGGGLQITTVSTEDGCVAPQTITVIGQYVYWLSDRGVLRMDGSGIIEQVPVSEAIRDLVRTCLRTHAATVHISCAAYHAGKDAYLLAMPGIQQQVRGGATHGQTSSGASAINDGILAFHVPTKQWAIWAGCFPAALCPGYWTDNSPTVFVADYWGRVYRFSSQLYEFSRATGWTYSGTATTPFSSTTLRDSAASYGDASSYSILIGAFVWLTGGTGKGQVRYIKSYSGSGANPDELTVSPAWTTTPDATTTYRIGDLYWHADSGDWQLQEPGRDKALVLVRPRLDAALVSPNAVDVAVDATDANETGTGLVYSTGTLGTGVNPDPLGLVPSRGFVQCLRLAGRLSNAARPRIIGLVAAMRVFAKRAIL